MRAAPNGYNWKRHFVTVGHGAIWDSAPVWKQRRREKYLNEDKEASPCITLTKVRYCHLLEDRVSSLEKFCNED